MAERRALCPCGSGLPSGKTWRVKEARWGLTCPRCRPPVIVPDEASALGRQGVRCAGSETG